MNRADETPPVLDPRWEEWVAGSLIRGRPRAELVATLCGEGIAPERAEAEVARLAASAGVVAAESALRAVQLTLRLRRDHLRLGSGRIALRRGLSGSALMDEYVATQTPVVCPDLLDGWPALRWTWEALAERFGAVEVEVCEGRAASDQPTRRWKRLRARRPFADVVRRILDPATGDDLYLVANNAALEGPLAGLLADVRPIEGLLPAERLAVASAWIGPAGTRTALHHDVSDLVLCQILGRKEVLLAPPEEVELAERGAGHFGPDLDLDDPAAVAALGLDPPAVRRATVGPGDALLIPAGWWHQVRSLEPSVTLTFAGLPHPNDYRWFRPAPPDFEEP